MPGITSRLQKRNRRSYLTERRLFLFFGGTSSSRNVKPALWNSVPATSNRLSSCPGTVKRKQGLSTSSFLLKGLGFDLRALLINLSRSCSRTYQLVRLRACTLGLDRGCSGFLPSRYRGGPRTWGMQCPADGFLIGSPPRCKNAPIEATESSDGNFLEPKNANGRAKL